MVMRNIKNATPVMMMQVRMWSELRFSSPTDRSFLALARHHVSRKENLFAKLEEPEGGDSLPPNGRTPERRTSFTPRRPLKGNLLKIPSVGTGRLTLTCELLPSFSSDSTTDSMIDSLEDYSSHHRDQKAVEIQPRHARRTETVERPSTDDGTNYSSHDSRRIPSPVLLTILPPRRPANPTRSRQE
jgi:hypothetical protein